MSRPPAPKSLLKGVRVTFRWFRISLLFVAFLLVVLYVYLSQSGLPEPLRRPLAAQLRRQGLEFEYTQLRLHWLHGIIAEQVTLGRSGQAGGPQFHVDEVLVRFDWKSLRRFELTVDSLQLRRGTLTLPIRHAGSAPESLVVDRIMTELRWLGPDRWELEDFRAELLGAQLDLSASLQHPRALARWNWGGAATTAPATNEVAQPIVPPAWQQFLGDLSSFMRGISYIRPPKLRLVIEGDAEQPASISARLNLNLKGAQTRWGQIDALQLMANWRPGPQPDAPPTLHVGIEASQLASAWAKCRQLQASVDYAIDLRDPLPTDTTWKVEVAEVVAAENQVPLVRLDARITRDNDRSNPLRSTVQIAIPRVEGRWGQLTQCTVGLQMSHPLTNWVPNRATIELLTETARVGNILTESNRWIAHVVHDPAREPGPTTSPRKLLDWAAPYAGDWEFTSAAVRSGEVRLDQLRAKGAWTPPRVALKEIQAGVLRCEIRGAGEVDLATQDAALQLRLHTPALAWHEILGTNVPTWLKEISCDGPIDVEAQFRAKVPDPAGSSTEWQTALLSALHAQGRLVATDLGFRNLKVKEVASHFAYSNHLWHLPDLTVAIPEGAVHASARYSDAARDFELRLRSVLHPAVVSSWVRPRPAVMDLLQFEQAPEVEANVAGNLRDLKSSVITGSLRATNFAFRGEFFHRLQTTAEFANPLLRLQDVQLDQSNRTVRVPALSLDLETTILRLTNAASTVPPPTVTRAIGPKTAASLAPYQFLEPPTALVNGWICLSNTKRSDLHFEIEGGPFHYWRFNLPTTRAHVFYVNNTVTVSNLQAEFYRGQLAGNLYADLGEDDAATLRFTANVKDCDFHLLMGDLSTPTNRFEGILGGLLEITSAKSDDWKSWQGSGHVTLQDGLLWDAPLFGLFSPMLNTFTPGLGNSKAKSGQATFRIEDSLVKTDDLEIYAPPVRLQYRGKVDFSGNLTATVLGEMFRDSSVPGKVFNLALWPLRKLFEYKVTGTLGSPKPQPLYLPKLLSYPLQPLRWLKQFFLDAPSTPSNKSTAKPPE